MIIILQARICSKRLPGKALFTFFDQTIIERVCSIAQAVRKVDRIVFATGNRNENLVMRSYVEKMGIEFYVGSEVNVLKRFHDAINDYDGEYMLRLTCDNYLIQPDLIDDLYDHARTNDGDYAYISPLSHFCGELISCRTFRRCYALGYSDKAKEHVTWDIRNSLTLKKIVLPNNYAGLNHEMGITLDSLSDLLILKRIESEFPSLRDPRCLSTLRQVQQYLASGENLSQLN